DLGSAFRDGSFDLVVSNPPYVPENDRASIQREVREFEPAVALFGGLDGLDIYRRLVPEAKRLLKPGGAVIFEIAFNSADEVRQMFNGWREVGIRTDLAGLPRVVSARWG